MRLFRRTTGIADSHRRLVWQSVSLLLAYPENDAEGMPGYADRLALVEGVIDDLPPSVAGPLRSCVDGLTGSEVHEAAQRYVETFDLRRRRSLFLTYWTDGDTRNRGNAMLQFADAYREAGVEPPDGELPDHLAVVLEFGATVEFKAGMALLRRYRAPLALLQDALGQMGSPYAGAVEAVLATVPEPDPEQTRREAQRIAQEGPPSESVGLDPYSVTVPVDALAASLRTVGGSR
ncbi:nitrate reductase molybdenum cofactor assembly chaperone [Tomitella cavernea]|uniref:Nitrate reductase molybdenum cofactor assembly chaperone n=1 Tax=Tomitella cavernea TaxID=1387982 RepID=A0ABP9CFP6_9ACTN|nr:nitrate reductase molybdenum cofactor assembly chaperone [Tomitella cavernea]